TTFRNAFRAAQAIRRGRYLRRRSAPRFAARMCVRENPRERRALIFRHLLSSAKRGRTGVRRTPAVRPVRQQGTAIVTAETSDARPCFGRKDPPPIPGTTAAASPRPAASAYLGDRTTATTRT